MREISFRGKRVDNGEWAVGYLTKRPSAIQIGYCSPWYISVPPRHPEDDGGFYNVAPDTVGQYTGLKDKNGKKIFEGDIVRASWHAPRRDTVYEVYEVVYSKSGFFMKRNGKLMGQVSNYISPNVNMRCEIIGNIHDNPELIGGADV